MSTLFCFHLDDCKFFMIYILYLLKLLFYISAGVLHLALIYFYFIMDRYWIGSVIISAMLYASETWPLTKTNLHDRTMIRQICSIKPEEVATVRSSELQAKLELEDLNLILREREGFTGLGMWSILVVQSEQHVIYRMMAGGGQGGPS